MNYKQHEEIFLVTECRVLSEAVKQVNFRLLVLGSIDESDLYSDGSKRALMEIRALGVKKMDLALFATNILPVELQDFGVKMICEDGGKALAESSLEVLKEQASNRKALDAIKEKGQEIVSAMGSPTAREELSVKLQSISKVEEKGFISAHSEVDSYIENLIDPKDNMCFPTGYTKIDDFIGGYRKGQVTVIGAPPSTGKSSFAINSCLNLAINGTSTAFFSLEMSKEQVYQFIIAYLAQVHKDSLSTDNGPIQEDILVKAIDASKRLKTLPFFFNYTHTINVSKIRQQVRAMIETQGTEVFFIDFLQIIKHEMLTKNDSAPTMIGHTTRAFKEIAKEFNVAMVPLAQINRGAQTGKDIQRPRMKDLKGSGSIEEDADSIILMHRPKAIDQTCKDEWTEFIVVKNRGTGKTGITKMTFDPEYSDFLES